MKSVMVLLASLGLAAVTSAVQVQDRKITEVVKLLQKMLEQSKAEGDTEMKLYGTYKCYCDTNEKAKTEEIARLTEEIDILESKIEETQASTGELSKQVAKLDADMTQNEKDREEATNIRNKEHADFVAKEADLVQAIAQMRDAVATLAAIGADQSMNSAQDHAQYMAGAPSLLKLKASLKTALLAASAFVSRKQVAHVESFLQAPFTGTYSARSGEVVGILKSMRDTFEANLKQAREEEARALESYTKFMEEMLNAYNDIKASFEMKQSQLSSNDGELSSMRTQLITAQATLAEAQDFLAKLLEMCETKKNQYDGRVQLRAEEQTALTEAIAILNSDAAFANFGKVSATSSGLQFIQRRSSIRQHRQLRAAGAEAGAAPMKKALGFLQAAEQLKGSSPLLGRIVAMIQANNPFKVVVEEIEKMIKLIVKEGKADAEQKAWCDQERMETTTAIETAEGQIRDLTTAIDTLNALINDPVSGLIVQIKNTEDSLQTNNDEQVEQTKFRKEDNDAYNKDIANLQEAEALVSGAIKVLSKYYSKITDKVAAPVLAQIRRDDPAPPATWEDKFAGQGGDTGAVSAVDMLKFILADSVKEEEQAHTDELKGQHDYEDSMTALKEEQATLQESLASLNQNLAEAQKELMLKQEDLAKTLEEKAALEAYLEKIKPGCDFITANIDMRVEARGKETAALESARTSLKGSAAFKNFEEKQHQEDLGECQEICKPSEAHVNCKACLAKTSVPGFCAGKPTTEGC